MNKRRLLGLILFANLIIAGMFIMTELLVSQSSHPDKNQVQQENDRNVVHVKPIPSGQQDTKVADHTKEIPVVTSTKALEAADAFEYEEAAAGFATATTPEDSYATSTDSVSMPQLIFDCSKIDYESYIPKMLYDDELEAALNIDNPDIDIDAESAILFDAGTEQVLYYKNPVQTAFPASTLKLLTSLVALNWCSESEEVTIGDEIELIASDSTRAYLKKGEILSIKNLLEAMLLPSGNDAAYAVAAYVGRKALGDPTCSREKAVTKFVELMNDKAKELGVKNSCFKTPDGYDAVGQYTTAYDMGLIGMAAASNDKILEVTGESKARTTFVSGQDVTWTNTNKLIKRYSGEYYAKAIGLKTGTSTMAGRCLIAAAKSDSREVVCVILDSTSAGRWEDAIKLLKYGLK